MMNFNEKQRKELEESAIASDIADLNISDLSGNPALQSIFHALGNEERINTGQVKAKWLREYDPIYKDGGWAFFGVDPLTDERTECISFKPNTRISPNRKYENPPKAPPVAFYPAVTYRVWKLVAERFNVPMPAGLLFANPTYRAKGFWAWVLENNIPIILTEGCKKALSAISTGFPCVAITGIWNGVRAMKNDRGETDYYSLISSLRILKDKKILIAFDRDEKARTIANVMKARAALASALISQDCECYSIQWKSKYKGLDDLIAGAGVEALEKSISEAKPQTGEQPNFKKKIVKNMMGEDLAKESKGRMCFDAISKTWQIYTDGRWKPKGQDGMEALIYHRVVQDVPEINSASLIPDIMKFMKYKLTVEEWQEASTLEFFPFKNGVWSFKEKKLLPHSPDYFWKWQLDRDYSPIATGWHSIDRFLHTVTNGNSALRDILIAACAAVLHGRSDLQQAFYLFGSGANGKGSFMRLLEMLVGGENSYSTTLETLCENKFETANIYRKRLVICPDEDRRVGGLSVFKSIVGEDTVRGEEKGSKAFQFVYEGMVAIASNDPIFMGDSSYGLSRRLISIPFAHTIPNSKRRNLTAEFTADLPAFTTYLLHLDRDWVTTTLKAANSLKEIKDLEWQNTTRTDSIAAFYDDKLIVAPGVEVSSAIFFEAYKEYCSKKGFSPKHENNFCPSLERLCKDKLQQDVETYRTKKGKVFKGLRFKVDSDWVEECDGVTAVTAVTAKTENFEIPISVSTPTPKPPTIDRPIPEIIEHDDWIAYKLAASGDRIEWIEIAFHKHSVSKTWGEQISLWGGQVEKPHQIKRNGNKWLLRSKNLPIVCLAHILNANIGQPPQAPSRR